MNNECCLYYCLLCHRAAGAVASQYVLQWRLSDVIAVACLRPHHVCVEVLEFRAWASVISKCGLVNSFIELQLQKFSQMKMY